MTGLHKYKFIKRVVKKKKTTKAVNATESTFEYRIRLYQARTGKTRTSAISESARYSILGGKKSLK